jgi:hypothetical protein
MIARGPRRSSSGCRLILGCILAAFPGGAISVAQSPITPTKPLTTPGLNQPLLVPPATTSKNSPSATGSGLGLGAQSVPGISPVTNPQASKGGSDAEKIDSSRKQKVWLPQNFRSNVEGPENSMKRDGLAGKHSTNSDEIGAARDYSKPPSKKTEGARFGPWGPGYTPDKSSNDKTKYGTYGPGYSPDKSSNDKSKYGTYGAGYTPDKSSNDKSKYGTYGPGYTADKSSTDKSKYGTWGWGYTPDKSSTDKSKFGTWGPGYTPDKSSKEDSTSGKSQSENQDGDKQTQSSQTPSQ